MSNPANLVAGLLDERDSAVRAGNDRLVDDIDAQLQEARARLEEFEPTGVDEESQRRFVAGVRRRLDAFDRGETLAEPAGGAARVHNPANYLAGLLDEREGAARVGRETADIDAEIDRIRPHFEDFQPLDDENGDARAHYAAVRRRLAAADGEDARKGGKGAARTTKAPAAPRTATPPPAE